MKAHARRLGHGCGPWSGSMGGRGGLAGGGGGVAGDEAGRAELERLGRSAARREADRARAVLWSLDGETSATIAARRRGPALAARGGGPGGARGRRWRSGVRSGGVAALRARPRPGRTPRKREAALAVARDLLAAPVADRPVWTLARLAAEIRTRTGETVSPGHLSVVLRKGATAGVGRGTPSRGGRTRTRSTARGCA